MSGFIEGEDRHQATLFPERLDDYIAEDNAVRVIRSKGSEQLDLGSKGRVQRGQTNLICPVDWNFKLF